MFPRLPRLLRWGLPLRAGALCAVGCVAARAWVWGPGVRHLELCVLVRPGTWVVGMHLRPHRLPGLTRHLASCCSGALGSGTALSMVMSCVTSSLKAGRKDPEGLGADSTQMCESGVFSLV